MNTFPSRFLPKNLLKTQSSTIKNIFFLQKYNELSLLRRFCQVAADEIIHRLNYSTEESEKILNVVNSKPSEELLRYNISKTRIKKIESFKTKKGQFQSLDEILQLDNFGANILQKFCDSILNETTAAKKEENLRRPKQFTKPAIPEAIRPTLKSCVAVHVGALSVSWARLELISPTMPSEMTHWHYYDIIDKRLLLNDLVQKCLYIDYLIPEADCYVLEAPQIPQNVAPGSAEQINVNMQKAQLTAILSFALAKRGSILNNDEKMLKNFKVFYLRRFLSARLYRTLIGSERVSTEQIVLNLMRTHYNIEDANEQVDDPENNAKHAASVSISTDLRNQYKLSEGYQREFLGRSLLLGLTFTRLCLLKCPYSIGIVTGSSKDSIIK